MDSSFLPLTLNDLAFWTFLGTSTSTPDNVETAIQKWTYAELFELSSNAASTILGLGNNTIPVVSFEFEGISLGYLHCLTSSLRFPESILFQYPGQRYLDIECISN